MDFSEIRKIFGTNEYRGLNSVERAILLHEKEGISLPKAAEICSIHLSQLRRALRAKREGREIGVNGRPQHFNDVEEAKIVSYIRENIPQEKRRYDVMQETVSSNRHQKVI